MNPEIDKAKENFRNWFIKTIDLLSKEEFTGIPLLMISFPLFERYADAIKKNKFQAFCEAFQLHDRKEALIVWKSFRNGILHNASFNTEVDLTVYKEYKSKEYIYQCGVKDDIKKEVHIEQNERMQWTIFISPSKFAKKVIRLVLDNFERFYEVNEKLCPFSSVQQAEKIRDGYSGISDFVPLKDRNGSNGYSGWSKSDSFCGHTDSHNENNDRNQDPSEKS